VTPTQAIVYRVKTAHPEVKVIGFPRGAGLGLADYARDTGVDGLSLDWTVPLADARSLQRRLTVQGNLDPMRLMAGGRVLDAAIDRILEALSSGSFIFNLGHGILPETPIAHVERLVARVRGRDA
jgi:uroporphyrinogen decarboxylase